MLVGISVVGGNAHIGAVYELGGATLKINHPLYTVALGRSTPPKRNLDLWKPQSLANIM